MPLILASGSAIRKKMLEDAGVEFEVVRPDIDEAALKAGKTDPSVIAAELAEAKALSVSERHPEDWVVGSDSVVEMDGRLFDKPQSRADAADHLRGFSGRILRLFSGVALARSGAVEWRHVGFAQLSVRELSDEFIHSYLDAEWPAVGQCVGVFRMEGPGVQLFDNIEGGHFTILGMPLLPLLQILREKELLLS